MAANLKLKGLRVMNDKTQLDMSKFLGVSETTYNMKEKGSRKFTLREAELISYYFSMKPDDVMEVFFTGNVHAKRTKAR